MSSVVCRAAACRVPANAVGLAICLAALLATSGCREQSEIREYQAPKELAAAPPKAAKAAGDGQQVAADTGAGADRMLAAIIPRGEAAWSFKLTGPEAAVAKHAEEFDALVKSVTFPAAADGKPRWQLPEGWKERLDAAPMRYATLTTPGEPPLELTVAPFSWPEGRDAQNLLANLNRWRGQMQLPPIEEDELEKQTRKVAAGELEAVVVDLTGTYSGGMPPFAGGAKGKGAMPADHPPVKDAKKADAAKSDAQPSKSSPAKDSSAAKTAPKDAAQDDAGLPFTFQAPADWKPVERLPMFAVAAYSVQDAPGVADVTITALRNIPGGLLANVNRWREQLGLKPVERGELDTVAKAYQVDGKPGFRVELVSPEGAQPRRAIVAVLFNHEANEVSSTWFLTMKTDAAVAEAQRENFQKFAESVKFR